ncbi:3-oxoacyl-ACP reductase FabG [Pelagibius marinus]|uniref:3-oxoacyl-ACP reductase FabG n=1 Tax=Pelagibius marinus TaxID=2762760 RepID=UPI00187281E6|nr:3-oxoacyl-ACP reductase FabG [Pelagibius marinus]
MTRSVLVTGASGGLGRAISRKLAGDGFEVVLHFNRGRQAVEDLAAELSDAGGKSRLLQFDVTERSAATAAIEQDLASHGAYYGVVCNAGIHRDNAFPAMPGEDWDLVLRTNLDGFYNVVHPVVLPMVQARRGGRIVVMSSISGIMGNRGQVNYSAAKGGLIAAAKALAIELAKRRITVNCVAPGVIETEMTEKIERDEVIKMIPARRFGQPEEVASLVGFLFSEEASYITRQVISVNGGMA